MKKQPLDRARIEHITRYVQANSERIGDAVKALMVDDDGEALPFVLLLPMGNGTQTIANLAMETVAGMMQVLGEQLQREALAKMFARALTESVARVIDAAELVPHDEAKDGDDGKVH